MQNPIRSRLEPLGRAGSTFARATAVVILALNLHLSPSGAFAQATPKEPLGISLSAMRVARTADGNERLEAAKKAAPGDVLQYIAVYSNQSAGEIRDLRPTLPVPAGMECLPLDVALPAPTHASLDGKRFEPLPVKRAVKRSDGSTEQRVIPASEFRALRWFVSELKAGETITVTARMRVIPLTAGLK